MEEKFKELAAGCFNPPFTIRDAIANDPNSDNNAGPTLGTKSSFNEQPSTGSFIDCIYQRIIAIN